MMRASVDSRLRLGFSARGAGMLLSATGPAGSGFGGCVGLMAAGRSTYFGASVAFGASTALGCSAAAGSSFEARVRPLVPPAWAVVADTRTNAAIRMNLRIRSLLSLPGLADVGGRLGRSKQPVCEEGHAAPQ